MSRNHHPTTSFSTIGIAALSALIATLTTHYFHTHRNKQPNTFENTTTSKDKEKEDVVADSSHDDEQEAATSRPLGPTIPPETQYQLALRGTIDTIYEHDGPNPFEFNKEVCQVFDDMVSRSVPLYCEVIDLAIYWFQKYYQPNTKVYDLGCSTGTTIDVLARSLKGKQLKGQFVGIDNSSAMVDSCRTKLEWAKELHDIDITCGDILSVEIQNASFVIMNYTLQFIPVAKRSSLLQSIHSGLCKGGVLLLSEKVRTECSELQETCTSIYEDFKHRRKYTKREIARKKEALMNVLVPFTEGELKRALMGAGFGTVEIIAKWNNFTTFVARKKEPVDKSTSKPLKGRSTKKRKQPKKKSKIATVNLDNLFDDAPTYLSDLVDPEMYESFLSQRASSFAEKGIVSNNTLREYDEIARMIIELPNIETKKLVFSERNLTIGDADELGTDDMNLFQQCIHALKPWKKGPLNLFGTKIDTEWRSDLKWKRLQTSLPDLKDKVVCDLGCGNGYFMFRMLEYDPKLVCGIDPNLHAFLEFSLFKKLSGVDNVKFELLRGDCITSFPHAFDVVFCLGVLYHTNDPIGMLRDIHKSMKGNSVSCLIIVSIGS